MNKIDKKIIIIFFNLLWKKIKNKYCDFPFNLFKNFIFKKLLLNLKIIYFSIKYVSSNIFYLIIFNKYIDIFILKLIKNYLEYILSFKKLQMFIIYIAIINIILIHKYN